MQKSTTAIGTFIDDKYIPLAPKFKLAIAVLIALIPLIIFYLAYYRPHDQKEQILVKQKADLEVEIRNVKQKASNLVKFKKELDEANDLFVQTSALLPREKEIPKLLKDISALGRNAGLDFLTFKPEPDNPKDFYAEIPVTINVRGPYHNMGFFFDQVSKLERIVTVSNVKMSSPKKEGGEMLLDSDCRLVTYRFTNVELPKQPKK